MKVLIVEDELMARQALLRILRQEYDDMEIIGEAGSVAEVVAFLKSNSPDVIFMDVELEDGSCFEIFRRTRVEAKVIMTTAYDSYAIKAFETGSIDYLLKPIEPAALRRAVGRCREQSKQLDVNAILAAIGSSATQYKERFLISAGEKFIPVKADEIAYFYSEDKANYIMTKGGVKYIFDSTIDTLEKELDPSLFFRISRGCIIALSSISSVSRHVSGKMIISANPRPPFEMTVSRARVAEFLEWMK